MKPHFKAARVLTLSCTVWLALVANAVAATYTVSPGDPAAADTNPGFPQGPFKSLDQAIRIARPGDTIVAMPGKYPRLAITQSGTKDKPITLKAAAAPDQKHVDQNQLIDPAKPSTFPGNPKLNAVSEGFDLTNAKFIRIENFEITNIGNATAAIFLKNTDSIAIVNNFLHDLNPKKGNYGGVRSDTHDTHNTLIKDNTLFRCQGTSICTMGENWIVEGNDVSHGTNLNLITGENVGGEDAVRIFGKGHIIRQQKIS